MKIVLVYSKEYKQMDKMLDVLENEGFHIIPCLTIDILKRCVELATFDLVLIGDLDDSSSQLIKSEITNTYPNIKIVNYFEPHDNLINKIKDTLQII